MSSACAANPPPQTGVSYVWTGPVKVVVAQKADGADAEAEGDNGDDDNDNDGGSEEGKPRPKAKKATAKKVDTAALAKESKKPVTCTQLVLRGGMPDFIIVGNRKQPQVSAMVRIVPVEFTSHFLNCRFGGIRKLKRLKKVVRCTSSASATGPSKFIKPFVITPRYNILNL
jgi:hypothetical protein